MPRRQTRPLTLAAPPIGRRRAAAALWRAAKAENRRYSRLGNLRYVFAARRDGVLGDFVNGPETKGRIGSVAIRAYLNPRRRPEIRQAAEVIPQSVRGTTSNGTTNAVLGSSFFCA